MALLEFVAIWFVISVVVGVLLGIAIHRLDDGSFLSDVWLGNYVRQGSIR